MKISAPPQSNRSTLTTAEIEELIEDADVNWPDNEFVESVSKQFERTGSISAAQERGLRNVAKADHSDEEDDHFNKG